VEPKELTKNRLRSIGTMLCTIVDGRDGDRPYTWRDMITWQVQEFFMKTGKFPKKLLVGTNTYSKMAKDVYAAVGEHIPVSEDSFIYQGIVVERYDKEKKAIHCLW